MYNHFNPSDLVDKSTPFVHSLIWEKLCTDGWRWVQNFNYSEKESAKRTIAQLQSDTNQHGVAVGHPFIQNQGPTIATAKFGIYLKDGEKLLDLLRKELDAFVGI